MNHRTGKIARLPKDLREIVNRMLDDGAQYESIIQELNKHRHRWPDGVNDISINNMSNWHSGGYQDWVREQEAAADLQQRNEFLKTLLESNPGPDLHQAVVHLGLAQIYHTLLGFDRDAFQARAAEDPSTYARLLSVLLRFSDHALALQKLQANAKPPSTGDFVPKALPAPQPSTNNPQQFEHNSRSIITNSNQLSPIPG
jgi:hypothetical protein